MSRFKKCESCGIVVTKIKRSRFDKMDNWDAIRWQRPNDIGKPDHFIGQCNDGSFLKEVSPVFIFCKTCVECYNLMNLEVDMDTKEWVVPQEIEKVIDRKHVSSVSRVSTIMAESNGHKNKND